MQGVVARAHALLALRPHKTSYRSLCFLENRHGVLRMGPEAEERAVGKEGGGREAGVLTATVSSLCAG